MPQDMSKTTRSTIEVQAASVAVISQNQQDYISLTDMAKKFGDDALIYGWMRNRNTLEFIGIWEQIHNPAFKGLEFETFKNQAGLNSFSLTPRKWIEATAAIGFQSRAGRYGGGTYAHRDIAFEFGSWLSPEFKLYLIKEFQRLKDEENDRLKLGWNLQRTLAKINYRIHTDAIKETLIPRAITKQQASLVYANEADLLNVALFGQTAREWRDAPSWRRGEYSRPRATGTACRLDESGKPQLRSHPPGSAPAGAPAEVERNRHFPVADIARHEQLQAAQVVPGMVGVGLASRAIASY